MGPFERFYTPEEAGEIFCTDGQTIRLWVRKGVIVAYKPGRKYLIPESEIKRILAETKVQADA